RLGIVMGFYLGLEHGVLALFLSYLLGAIVGLVLIATKKRSMKSSVPFGTFLALGTMVAAVFGDVLLNWYLGYFSF
ncbi:MAG: prepilin peptidase, partial [bacterium]|nr:prepilin peptidase [bacterium]